MPSLGKPGTAVIDCGPLPVYQASLSLTIPGCTAATPAVCHLCCQAPPGKDADELEMDALYIWAVTSTDAITLYIRGLEGYIHDKFVVVYAAG